MIIELSNVTTVFLRNPYIYTFSITANYKNTDETLIETKTFSINQKTNGTLEDNATIKTEIATKLKDLVNDYKTIIENKLEVETTFSTISNEVDSLIKK